MNLEIESYESVLGFLEEYFSSRVSSEYYLQELLILIEGSREKRTVTIRPIHELFTKYRNEYRDFSITSPKEIRMWTDLLDVWQ